MQLAVGAMRGKKIVLTALCVLFLGACSNSEISSLHTKDLNFDMPDVTEFKKTNEDLLSKNSVPIDYMMTPNKLSNNGILVGTEGQSIKTYDLNAKSGKTIYTMKTKSDSDVLGLLAISNDFLIFREIINSKNYKYYLLELSTGQVTLIKESKNLSSLVFDEAIIYNDIAYLFLCDKTNNEQGYTYNGYTYNLKTKKLNIFEDKKSVSFPCMLDKKLYYLQIDNENLTTELIQYDPDNGDKTVLLDGNLENGYISELKSNGNELFVFVSKENGKSYCYRYQPEDREIQPYISMDSTDGLTLSKNYMTWINWNPPNSRFHTMYYILDINNDLLYSYQGSEIVQADNQLVWTKFQKDETKIPKGEIYKDENVQLMWTKF